MKDLIRVANQTFNRSSQKCKSKYTARYIIFYFILFFSFTALPDNIESLRLENMSLCQKVSKQSINIIIDSIHMNELGSILIFIRFSRI